MPGSNLIRMTAAPHPLKVERSVVELPEGLNVLQLLELAQADPYLRQEAVVFIGGEKIPKSMWKSVKPRAGSHIEVRVLPPAPEGGGGGGGKNPLRTILTIAVVAVALWAGFGPYAANFQAIYGNIGLAVGASASSAVGVGQAIVGLTGMLAMNAITAPRPPKMNQLSGTSGSFGGTQDSPTLFIQGARNQSRPFSPVPVLLGKHKIVPSYGALPYTEVIGDKQFVRMLFVWGVGPIQFDASQFRIGETLLSEFSGVQVEHREGYAGDDPITLYPDQVVSNDLTVSLTAANGWQSRTSSTNADELSIDITFPRGLVQFSDTGSRGGRSVVLEIEYRLVGEVSWTQIDTSDSKFQTTVPTNWMTLSGSNMSYVTFTHSKTAAVRHGFRWPVATRGQYDIRVRRTTADSDSTQVVDETTWTAIRTITDEDPISSPVPLAKTALVIQASEQLNRIIDEFSGVATSVGKDWNGASWDDDQPIQNPAALFRLALQGNGIAEPLPDARIDLSTLQDWHDFCVAKGFKFNMLRDFQSSVWDMLSDVCAAGRAAPTQIDGKWSVVIEQEQAVPVSHVTPRNSYGFQAEKMFPDLPHAWRVRFPNEDEGWRQDEYRVYRDGYTSANATKFESLELPGVTDPDQVYRIGRFRIAQGILQPERWTFNQDMEYLTYRRGDRIKVTHDVLLIGLNYGRIKSVSVDGSNNVTGVTLDVDVTMETAVTYGISIRTISDAEITRQIRVQVGTVREITFTSSVPAVGGEPAIDVGNVFGFGLLGAETDDASVVSVQPDNAFRAHVVCVPYRSGIFDADSETLPEFETNLTPVPSIPQLVVTGVKSDESVLARGPGESLRCRIGISFVPFSGTAGAGSPTVEVQYRPTSTGEPYYNALVDEISPDRVLIGGVNDGDTWDIRLRHVIPGRLVPGAWTYVNNHTVVGRSSPPSALSGMTVSVFGGQALIRWDQPTELDVEFGGYVRFRHSPLFSGATWAESASIGDVAQARTLFATLPLKPGTYLARVYDVLDTPSDDVVSVTTKQASVLTYASLDTLDEDPGFTGTHSGTWASGGTLSLLGAAAIDDWGPVDDVADWDSEGGIISEGTYTFASGFDFVSVTKVRLTTRVTMQSVNVLDLIDSRTGLIDDWEDFDGTTQAEADVRVEVRHTDDDPASTSPSWSTWERLDSAEFEARGFQFRAILSSNDPAFNVLVTDLGITAEELA